MDVLSTKWFRKWSKKANLKNQDLLESIKDLEDGLSTANLGNHLFKVRVKREHGGKSSGYRTIIAYQEDNKAIFLYGFGKNEKENISNSELHYFKNLGNDLLALNKDQLKQFVKKNILFEIEVTE
ncbi:MAG: type II toxin-antitoxin system RelE/ParE family toxin [Sedimenticola sp.]